MFIRCPLSLYKQAQLSSFARSDIQANRYMQEAIPPSNLSSFTKTPRKHIQLAPRSSSCCVVRQGAIRSQVSPTIEKLSKDASRVRLEAAVSFISRLMLVIVVGGGRLLGNRTTLWFLMCVCCFWCNLMLRLIVVWTYFVDQPPEFLLSDGICWVFLSIRLEQQWNRNLD